MTTFWRKVVVRLGYFAAALLILVALLVSITRLLTPILNDYYRPDFEKLAGRLLNRPVQLGQVTIALAGFEPELEFRKVVILDPETHQPNLEIPFIRIDIAILNSLFSRTFILDSLKITGVHLTLREPKPGEYNIEGFNQFSLTDNLTGHSLNPNVVLTWIFSQPKLVLQNFDIDFISHTGDKKSVTLKRLALNNSSNNHTLTGKAVLNQNAPTQIGIRFDWQGNITDLPNVSADLYLYLQNISLPQWFEKKTWQALHIKQGVGSAKIWAKWNNNTWQKIQTTLQFYDIQAESLATEKNLNVARFSGNINWERDGDKQTVSGDNILIDLPNHLWPTTHFTVKFSKALDGTPTIKNIYLSYIDLADAYRLIEASGLLPHDDAEDLVALEPQGEMRDIKADIKGPLNDPANFIATAQFSGLTFRAWKKLPPISQLSGMINWNGSVGSMKIDSQHMTIAIDQIFDKPLTFDQFTGLLSWQKEANGNWLLSAKALQAINQAVNTNTDFSMTFPMNDSPSINLTSHFSLSDAKEVIHYLPLKIFQPELIAWLRHAFLGGQVVSGQAVLQGKLSDFPFANGLGKFEIGGEVNNVDLDYAPHWPVIHNINGKILFSGKSMTVDLTAAQISEVPLQNIHVEIPDLGDNPILTAKSVIQADLAQGLQFIEQSPLQQTIGKNLSALKLQGPMQLTLNLAVPLNHPADVKVEGDTTLKNAILNLPDWNLAVNQLSGAFKFTEDSVTASHMTGQLFGRPIMLDLLTQHPKGQSGYVSAILQGAVNTTDLKTWLDLPVEEILQGTTNYKAELILPPQHASSQPTQVIIHSDLNGVAVNLPGQYGKKMQDIADFQLSFLIKENQPLKAKVFYNKLFSLAMTLQRIKQKFGLLSADLHLGNGEANWQAQEGVVVTGNVDQINWDKIAPYVSQFTAKASSQKNLINPDLFRGVDIRANLINFSGFQLKNMRVQLNRADSHFVLGLNNADMAGEIILPRGGIQQGIQAKFQRLNLPSNISNGQRLMNPRSLPPISFVGEDVRYGDMMLGQATLNLQPTSGGMLIKQLDLVSSAYKLHAVGAWLSSRSHLQGNVTTANVTDLLKSWGFSSNNFVGSKGDADFDLNWLGGFFTPSIQGLSGNVSLKLGEGRIINLDNATDAKMGLGRLLNIFSLQSLPRRLSLNFSDLFEKGYSFDSVKGDFILRNGNAITQNTHFKGSIASIEISGRIGLAAKDLDMKMSVTPYVTSSLPVVAAIATANPIVGVASWVVDKMVSPAVSQMTTYNYSITGSWANPVWNQMNTQRGQAPHS